MSSSKLALAIVVLAAGTAVAQPAQGFAVDRFYAAPPGNGWLVMDDLNISRELGGALSFALEYAHDPLTVDNFALVDNQVMADIGAAVTFRRVRIFASFTSPIAIDGTSGSVGTVAYTAPSVSLTSNPDSLSDPSFGAEVLLIGEPHAPFRFGVSGQLFVPNGKRSDYDTDDTVRVMLRALVAGDSGMFSYAAQLGVHIRSLDEPSIPGNPVGSELLFGVAGGVRLADLVVGPEIYGVTVFDHTGVEGLVSASLEPHCHARFKLGVGGGLDPSFGAPEFRAVIGVELSGSAR